MAKSRASNRTDVRGEGFNRSSNEGGGFDKGAGWTSEAGVGKGGVDLRYCHHPDGVVITIREAVP